MRPPLELYQFSLSCSVKTGKDQEPLVQPRVAWLLYHQFHFSKLNIRCVFNVTEVRSVQTFSSYAKPQNLLFFAKDLFILVP